ncbi:histidine kinase [Runella zeae]|uniref:ATP-binding protein n=1 Tax=Runella zeae TaxID=94255 RepID=UPI002352C255|nr:histidine kinase [Runella zeae]
MPIRIPKRFTRLYIMALSLVAFLTILGQILVQNTLKAGLNDSWLVNYAGRQRFQSQLIAKTALLLTQRPDLAHPEIHLLEFKKVLADWELHHHQLKTGDLTDIQAKTHNGSTLQKMFEDIEPHFQAIRSNAHLVLNSLEKRTPLPNIDSVLKNIFDNELVFLRKMDRIVFQYDKEAKEKVTNLRNIEMVLMVLTLFVLFLEGLFIFRPAVAKLRESILQLIEAREKTIQTNKELNEAYQQLRVTQAQLLEATQNRHRQELKEHKIHAAALVQGQENERKRLSKELHDGVGQMLTGLKMMTESLVDIADLKENERQNILSLRDLVGQTIQEVRHISNNLMPPVLHDFGISLALKQLTYASARNTHASLSFSSNVQDQRFDPNVEIGIYRIAQEALHNAIKHAHASQITLSLTLKSQKIVLQVKDNGRGFKISKKKNPTQAPQHGLHNLQERAHLLDGTLKINSTIGEGTEILVQIPQ